MGSKHSSFKPNSIPDLTKIPRSEAPNLHPQKAELAPASPAQAMDSTCLPLHRGLNYQYYFGVPDYRVAADPKTPRPKTPKLRAPLPKGPSP